MKPSQRPATRNEVLAKVSFLKNGVHYVWTFRVVRGE